MAMLVTGNQDILKEFQAEEILSFPPRLMNMTQYYPIRTGRFGKCFKIFCLIALTLSTNRQKSIKSSYGLELP